MIEDKKNDLSMNFIFSLVTKKRFEMKENIGKLKEKKGWKEKKKQERQNLPIEFSIVAILDDIAKITNSSTFFFLSIFLSFFSFFFLQ